MKQMMKRIQMQFGGGIFATEGQSGEKAKLPFILDSLGELT